MYLFVAVVLNLFNVLCLFGFVLITCGGRNNPKSKNNVPLVQQTPVLPSTEKPTSIATSAPIEKVVNKKQPPPPPSNVPVAAPKANDHTMKEVESMKMEWSKEN